MGTNPSVFFKAKSFEKNLEALPNLPIISKQIYTLALPQQYQYTKAEQRERFGEIFKDISPNDKCGTYFSLQHAAGGSMELINE